MVDLTNRSNGFFITRFEAREDREWVLAGGPWNILGYYLSIRSWTPNFNPWEETINKVALWARILELPVELHNKIVLGCDGFSLGKLLKIDAAVGTKVRNFARICVELDTNESIVPEIEVCGRSYIVEYEGMV